VSISCQALIAFQSLNLSPTLSPITSPTEVNEDSGSLVIPLSGISAGSGENQPLRVTVTSDNLTLFAVATVDHSGVEATGSVRLTLAANQSGQSLVTVNVMDGGLDFNLDTVGDNASVEQSFTVTVNPLNDPPTTTADQFSFVKNSGAHTLDVLANDSIAPDIHELLTLIFVAPPPAAVGSLAIDGSQLRYSPAPGDLGTFTTQYFVSDGGIPVPVGVTIEVKNAANVWHNINRPFDVRGGNSIQPDNFVDAGDALAIINYINTFNAGPVPVAASPGLP
jgi:hypothetical protein